LALFCGLGLSVGAFRAQADEWDKKTILTVEQPIQVSEIVLQPGKYVLKLLDSQSDRHVVQIFNSDGTHLVDTVLAVPNYRLKPTGHSSFMFWETPAGHANALRAWFYPGDNVGQEFTYPKNLLTTEMAASKITTTTTTATTATAQAEENTADRAAPEPEPQPATPAPTDTTAQATTPEPKQTVEMAQNTPPPAAETRPAETAPKSMPSTLPQTGSNYPMIGLAGLVALCLFGTLRMKRSA